MPKSLPETLRRTRDEFGGPNADPPASTPTGTKYDGNLLFEALVFGWTCADNGWNGEYVSPGITPEQVRNDLAGYFEQFLEQQPEPEHATLSDGTVLRDLTARQLGIT